MFHHVLNVNEKHRDNNNEVLQYQNSYQLGPYDFFKTEHIDKIIHAIIMTSVESNYGNRIEHSKMCNQTATNILMQIQKLQFGRYKIIVIMTIIENASQSFDVSIGHLWDVKRDNYTTFALETRMHHVLCCVFGIYYE